ncbi:MAG: MerR family DNA-binding transcriptional regulator [Candidatus Leucobacter sulfamidivorax]|nr:MerR family DNA-binding transcriptional regulator [Candidatus Leucobacter sulfamidivorax]
MRDSNSASNAESLAIGEASRALGVSVGTMRNWEREGKIESFRTPGGQRRFPASEIDRLRNARAAAGGARRKVVRAA